MQSERQQQQQQQQRHQLVVAHNILSPVVTSSQASGGAASHQWLAATAASSSSSLLGFQQQVATHSQRHETAATNYSQPGDTGSSRSSSRSSYRTDHEADLNDLVDCFREQTTSARNTTQLNNNGANLQSAADTRQLVSALQDHLKSAVAAAAAAAAAAAVSSASSPFANVSTITTHLNALNGTAQQAQPHQTGEQPPPVSERVSKQARQDFAPLDLKILRNYDWHHHDDDGDLSSRSSGRTSRSSLAPSPRLRSLDYSIGNLDHSDADDDQDDELVDPVNCVQRTEIVQTLSAGVAIRDSPQPDANADNNNNNGCLANPFSRDELAQNLVTTASKAASKTAAATATTRADPPPPPLSTTSKVSVSSCSLLAPASHQCPPAPSGKVAGDGSTATGTGNSQSPSDQPSDLSQQQQRQKRMFKCRHCDFETDQKVENWLHIRIHMRPERLLSCNSCEFVTEYKHHLEYHQRNHTGYKPFKCPHCDYTCVNKSMLNSHMKSHSTVYQYQCGDCKYATKYVHSLKMHLRKYQHQPAEYMIDIFARKRGPKPGSGRKQQIAKQQELERQIKEQVEAQRALQALQGTSAPPNNRRGGGAKRTRQSQAHQQQQQQQRQCILDLRVSSKLTS